MPNFVWMFVKKCLLLIFHLPFCFWAQHPLAGIQNKVFDLLDQKNTSGALREARNMVNEAKKNSRENDLWYAHSYFTLGTVEGMSNLSDSSEAHLLKAISCYERLAYQEAEYIDACRNVSLLYDMSEQYDEVIRYALKIVPLLKTQFEPESMDVGNVCFTLGVAYHKTGDYRESKTYLSKAKLAFEKTGGKNHLKTLRCAVNLGVLFLDLNLIPEATSYLEEAKQGMEAIGKMNAPEYITALNGLMVVHGESLDLQKVENIYLYLEEWYTQ